MDYKQQYETWVKSPVLSDAERAELEAIRGDEKEIESRFYMFLEFGTAGLRGTMGMGTNRMNEYVIRHATQAFADVILASGEDIGAGVAICYDCRINSELFAREAAKVIAAAGIPVLLFSELRPTPELSFAVRRYGCIAGINVTASHNPKEYNGYKVYWSDGAQLPPRHAAAISKRMEEIDVLTGPRTCDFEEAKASGLIKLLGEETDEAFLACALGEATQPSPIEAVADSFTMVYTPFHGTGWKLIPEALRRLGVKNLYCEPQQMKVDGNFPTVVSPNPENPEGFYLAIDLANEVGADFILGSDPDADRVGIMARDKDGSFKTISSNHTGALLLDYVIRARRAAGTLPENAVALKTIVTTELSRRVAEKNGLKCYDTFTGFKFLAEKKNALESSGEGKVLFSYEESCGYMFGDFVRDKDAVTAAVMLTEMAAWYSGKGMTLLDALDEVFKTYGPSAERTLNLVMPGLDGQVRMKTLMAKLRSEPPKEIAGTPVKLRRDYLDGTETDVATGKVSPMELKDSNVLSYVLADGSTVLVRPSGTEPKIKVYVLAAGDTLGACRESVAAYAAWAETLPRLAD